MPKPSDQSNANKPEGPPVPRAHLSSEEVAKLRVATMCKEKTIRRWAKGLDVTQATDTRIRRAANSMKIEAAT